MSFLSARLQNTCMLLEECFWRKLYGLIIASSLLLGLSKRKDPECTKICVRLECNELCWRPDGGSQWHAPWRSPWPLQRPVWWSLDWSCIRAGSHNDPWGMIDRLIYLSIYLSSSFLFFLYLFFLKAAFSKCHSGSWIHWTVVQLTS